jgi:hypothetical protein
MASPIDICNLALARIGRDETITSLTESSKAARKCQLFYDPCLAEVLARFPWAFAQRIQPLQLEPDAPMIPGYGLAYDKPADAVALTAIVPDAAVSDAASFFTGCCGPWNPEPYRRGVAYRQALADDGDRIVYLTNVPQAWAVYTAMIENTSMFPPLFVSMLADRLAMELAMPMTADPRWFQVAQRRYVDSGLDAAARELEQESAEPRRPLARSLQVRR